MVNWPMPTSVSAEGILTPNRGNLMKRFLFLDNIELHIRVNIFGSFTRVFRRN